MEIWKFGNLAENMLEHSLAKMKSEPYQVQFAAEVKEHEAESDQNQIRATEQLVGSKPRASRAWDLGHSGVAADERRVDVIASRCDCYRL